VELRRLESSSDGATVVEVTGDIDNFTAPQLRDELISAHEAGARVIVVDLTPTDFLDSSALGALVGVQKTLQADDAVLRVVCTKPHLRRVFEITRMTEVVPVFDSVEDATAS
jgi:anti-sigma B factor antagonist